MPPWIAGWSVFTRPPSISGEPVTSDTEVTARPADRNVSAVLPDDTRETPNAVSFSASSTTPLLSATEINARRTRTAAPSEGTLTSWLPQRVEEVHRAGFHLDASFDQHPDRHRIQA